MCAPRRWNRRQFIRGVHGLTTIYLVSACGFRPPWQQRPRVPRIGYLGIGAAAPNNVLMEAFHQGLHDLGYVEGQNLLIEYRFTDGRLEQGPALAAEIVALDIDLIVATGLEAVLAAKSATATIPIVGTVLGNDPVGAGLVGSLARPGGNVTGLGGNSGRIVAKRLELLKEVVPTTRRVAVLWNANNVSKLADFRAAELATHELGLEFVSLEVRRADEFEGAFQSLAASQADALMVLQEPLAAAHSARIAAVASEQTSPSRCMRSDSGLTRAG